MPTLDENGLRWEHDWDAAMARARQERRMLLVDVEKDN